MAPATSGGLATAPAAQATTFDSFRQSIDATVKASRVARQQHQQQAATRHGATPAPSSSAHAAIAPRVEELKLEDSESNDDDGRTLYDRITEPTSAFVATLSGFLLRSLELGRGELVLQLGAHNLGERSLVAVMDTPGAASHTSNAALPSDCKMDAPAVQLIISTFTQAAANMSATASVLQNPFDPSTGALPSAEELEKLQGPWKSSHNDEDTTRRWASRSLRILIRRNPEGAQDLNEVRAAVVGNVDAGKSSLLGVLTKGRLDDGRGRARVALFRHKHEIDSGRTSSVGLEILGFKADGTEVLPEGTSHALADKGNLPDDGSAPDSHLLASSSRRQQLSWEEISSKAAKIVSFADLAGHERYLKTTLFGLTSTSPDFVVLIVGANAGLIGMSKEHLSVSLALSVPVIVCVTKVDMTPPNVLEQTLKQLAKILRSPGCRKQAVFVKDSGMACELASGFVAERACPIFLVSNVTGQGLEPLKTFLNVARPSGNESRYPVDSDFEMAISDVFSVPFVGTVVSGIVLSGAVTIGQPVLLGPDSLGGFMATSIKSIQRKRVNVERAEAGQSVSFALKRIKRNQVRKGQVLVQKTDTPPKAIRRFEGQVLILYHNSLIAPRYQAMLHVGSVRQTVQIESIVDKPCIRTGDKALVRFAFLKRPEFVKPGDRILFREGKTKGLGVITSVLP